MEGEDESGWVQPVLVRTCRFAHVLEPRRGDVYNWLETHAELWRWLDGARRGAVERWSQRRQLAVLVNAFLEAFDLPVAVVDLEGLPLRHPEVGNDEGVGGVENEVSSMLDRFVRNPVVCVYDPADPAWDCVCGLTEEVDEPRRVGVTKSTVYLGNDREVLALVKLVESFDGSIYPEFDALCSGLFMQQVLMRVGHEKYVDRLAEYLEGLVSRLTECLARVVRQDVLSFYYL